MAGVRDNFLKYLALVNVDLADTSQTKEDLEWCKFIEYQGLDGPKILSNMIQRILSSHGGDSDKARKAAKTDLRKLAYIVLTRGTVYKKIVAKCTEDAKREVDKLIERYGVLKEGRPRSSVDLTLSRVAAVDPGQTAKAVIISRDISKFAPRAFYHFPGGMGLIPKSKLSFCLESWTDWSVEFDRIINPNSNNPLSRERAKLYGMAAYNACQIPDATREQMYNTLENMWNKSSIPMVPRSPRRYGGGDGGAGGGGEDRQEDDDQPSDHGEASPKGRKGIGARLFGDKKKSPEKPGQEAPSTSAFDKSVVSKLEAPEISKETQKLIDEARDFELGLSAESSAKPQRYEIGTQPAASSEPSSPEKLMNLEDELSKDIKTIEDQGQRAAAKSGGGSPSHEPRFSTPRKMGESSRRSGVMAGGSDSEGSEESDIEVAGVQISPEHYRILKSIKLLAADWALSSFEDTAKRVQMEFMLESTALFIRGAPKEMRDGLFSELEKSVESNAVTALPFPLTQGLWNSVPVGSSLPKSVRTFKKSEIIGAWREGRRFVLESTAAGSPPPTTLRVLSETHDSDFIKDVTLLDKVIVQGNTLYNVNNKTTYKSIALFVKDCLVEEDPEVAQKELCKLVGEAVPQEVA